MKNTTVVLLVLLTASGLFAACHNLSEDLGQFHGRSQAILYGQASHAPPYDAVLMVENFITYERCSSTMITPTIVLTAAHCLHGIGDETLDKLYVYAGPPDFNDYEGRVGLEVVEIRSHSGYEHGEGTA